MEREGGSSSTFLSYTSGLSLAGAATSIISVATKRLSRQIFVNKKLCRDEHISVATKDVFCRDKHAFDACDQMILVAAANDTGRVLSH